jgi:hypothetical protein
MISPIDLDTYFEKAFKKLWHLKQPTAGIGSGLDFNHETDFSDSHRGHFAKVARYTINQPELSNLGYKQVPKLCALFILCLRFAKNCDSGLLPMR